MSYTIPHIKDVLNNLYNSICARSLDLIIGYYNILLLYAAKKLCTITTPFVKYKYNRLTIGVCIEPDIFQEQMSALMENLEFFKVYINDFLVIMSISYKEHLAKVKEVMKKLKLSGIKFKIIKCKFTVPKGEYL